MRSILVIAFLCLAAAPAMAYVGPGAGLTLLSALWGLLVALLAAMAFLVVWPIRRWRRRRQEALAAGAEVDDDGSSAVEERARSETDNR